MIDLSFAYDGPLLTRVSWDDLDLDGSVAYTYDDNFWVRELSINDRETVGLDYDDDGLLVRAGELALERDPDNGQLTGTTLADLHTTWTRNGFGEVASTRSEKAGNELVAIDYHRDTAGRIVDLEETVQGEGRRLQYSYDEAGRLERVVTDGDSVVTYTYDANGNRLAREGPEGRTEGTYDAQDRMIANGDTEYEYNEAGQLEAKQGPGGRTSYDYDALGNLRGVSLADGTEIEYLIDARNRRVGKVVDGRLQHGFLYQDQLTPVAQLDEFGNVEAVFVYGPKPNVPAYMIRDGTCYRIISDHLGSVRLVVNVKTGDVVQEMQYDEFGRVQKDTNPGFQPFGFAGGLYDQHTGLIRFGVRDYDPQVGRWTSKDPILFAGGDPNLYGYVLGDPVNATDQLGLARFGKRPLDLSAYNIHSYLPTGDLIASGLFYVDQVDVVGNASRDFLNLELAHEQLWFDDGQSPSNLGYNAGQNLLGVPWPERGNMIEDDPDRREDYLFEDTYYKDELMRKAVSNVRGGGYCLFGNNCQDWADRVRKEYNRLLQLQQLRNEKCWF